MKQQLIEAVLRDIGASVQTVSDTSVSFEGGTVPYRPDLIILKRGRILFAAAADTVTCSVRVSLVSLLLPGLFLGAATLACLFAGRGLAVISGLAIVAIVAVLLGGKHFAQEWLVRKVIARLQSQADGRT